MARLVLYFQCSPLELDQEQLLDYLHHLKSQHKTPSESFFKHTIYGLRYLYRIYDLPEHRVVLPQIAGSKKLPVILSKEEVRLLIKTPKLHKHRLMLAMLYGCGLRCSELRHIELQDVWLDRMQLHIRQSKGGKDRYVPLCKLLVRGIHKHLVSDKPVKWLFTGKDPSGAPVALSPMGVQWVVKQARQQCGIKKAVTTHILRHTYATHLLEMGLDIMNLKEVLGHVDIRTTLIYLHVARCAKTVGFSPLEKLYS